MLRRFFFAPAGFALSPAAVRDVVRRVCLRSLCRVCSQSRCGQRLCGQRWAGPVRRCRGPVRRSSARLSGPVPCTGGADFAARARSPGAETSGPGIAPSSCARRRSRATGRPAHPSAGRGSVFPAEPFGNLLRQSRKNGPLRRVQSSLHVGRRSDKARVFSRRASARCGFSGVAVPPAGRTERPGQKFLIKFNKTLFRTFFRRKIPDILFTFAAC